MTSEQHRPKRPYEIFGMTEDEVTQWRISDEKLKEIIANPKTSMHSSTLSSNNFGKFLFLTASRGIGDQRICMTFYGYGYHEYRDRWISKEWFWHQTHSSLIKTEHKLSKKEVKEQLEKRLLEITPHLDENPQTERGKLFEFLADLSDDNIAQIRLESLECVFGDLKVGKNNENPE